MPEAIRNTTVAFERKGLPKSVESLMEQYSHEDIQLLCTAIYTEVLTIHTKENDLRRRKDEEVEDVSSDQSSLTFSKKYTGRIIQSLGFSAEQVALMFENPDPEQIETLLVDVIEKERERVSANLLKEGVLEKIMIAEQRTEAFFVAAGVYKQTAPVKHGGPVLQMIMKMRQIESESLNPMYATNQGEFYTDHGKAHVYHYDHESLTPDYYVSMHSHENVHTYGVGDVDEATRLRVDTDEDLTLNNFNGFSHVETSGVSKVRIGTFIDEGATQYMNKKALSGLVGDGEDTIFYPDEVNLYQELVVLVSEITGTSNEVTEQKLAYEYAVGGGLLHLKEYLSSVIPDEMEKFLK